MGTFAELEGFDHQIKDYYWYDGFNGEGTTASIGFTTGRDAAGKSVFINDSSSMRVVTHSLLSPLSEMAFGFARIGTSSSTSSWRPLQLDGSVVANGNAYNASVHLHLVAPNGTNSVLELYRGATLLATTASAYNFQVWNHFGVEVKIDDTAGYFRLYLNGAETPVIDFTGDTRNGGADALVRALRFGQGIGPMFQRTDDFYLMNAVGGAPTVQGDVKILTSRPVGNGAANQWVGNDGNSTDNYLLVDDDSTTTDYVQSPTAGNKDLYAMADLPAPPAGSALEVLAVQVSAYAAKTDAGTAKDLIGVFRSAGGTEVEGLIAPSASITASHQLFRGPIRTTDADGNPWTKATFDATQAGVKVGA